MGQGGINNLFNTPIKNAHGSEAKDDSVQTSKVGDSNFKDLLNSSANDIKFSQHAVKRLSERKIDMTSSEFIKIKEGFNKIKSKGGKDSLVVTDHGAYILDVDNRTVVTAMNKKDMAENVFTKIDSTLFMN